MRLAVLCLLGAAAPLAAQAPGPIAFERFTLPNGLEVVLAPDSMAPVVAVNLWVFAGSRYDPPGRGGLAQLFHRLAFAGSGHVTRGEHERLVTSAHGFFEAEVEDEIARFSETMPPERLNLALWLEAERLRGLRLDDSALALARQAELEARAADAQDAFAEPILTAIAALYDSTACFPYAHLGRGTPASLGAVTRSDVDAFFWRHYVPRNARLVVAGGFDRGEAARLVEAYFGGIAPGEPVSPPACDATAPPTARELRLGAARAAVAAAGLFYRIPGHDHADGPALELLGIAFAQGRRARLNRILRDSASAATTTGAGTLASRREAGVFGLFAAGAPGVGADSLASLLRAQVAWAQGPGLTEADLARARAIERATTVSGRQRPEEVAEAIQHAAAFHAGVEAVNTEYTRYDAVTLDDLRRVARTYLQPANAVTLLVTPGAGS